MCVTQSFGLLNNHFPYAYLSGDKKCILTLSQLLFKLSVGFIFKVKQETIYLLISGIDRGDVVSVYCDLEKKCRKGLIKPFDGQKVFVGNGIAALARKEIFCSKQNIRCVNMTLTSWGGGGAQHRIYPTPLSSNPSPFIIPFLTESVHLYPFHIHFFEKIVAFLHTVDS